MSPRDLLKPGLAASVAAVQATPLALPQAPFPRWFPGATIPGVFVSAFKP